VPNPRHPASASPRNAAPHPPSLLAGITGGGRARACNATVQSPHAKPAKHSSPRRRALLRHGTRGPRGGGLTRWSRRGPVHLPSWPWHHLRHWSEHAAPVALGGVCLPAARPCTAARPSARGWRPRIRPRVAAHGARWLADVAAAAALWRPRAPGRVQEHGVPRLIPRRRRKEAHSRVAPVEALRTATVARSAPRLEREPCAAAVARGARVGHHVRRHVLRSRFGGPALCCNLLCPGHGLLRPNGSTTLRAVRRVRVAAAGLVRRAAKVGRPASVYKAPWATRLHSTRVATTKGDFGSHPCRQRGVRLVDPPRHTPHP